MSSQPLREASTAPPELGSSSIIKHQYIHTARKNWKSAVLRSRDLPDPWVGLEFENIQEETVSRHMYNPRNRKWRSDEIVVKIQSESFAKGAMRECFRMKKLSTFSQNPNWKNASNYVAKRYMKEATRETYFDDVKLQMDSKLWGEEYSKLNIPKKVDFCQTYIIEFKARDGAPLYGVEHFIDGGYIKYNSNSGFVSDVNRLTPQAFSHFTFEKSNHQLIIVDIQGVGDLYTDPQMHTVDMKEYGEANLGTRGMALFFSTHICSPLCEMLKLTQFDLNEDELERLRTKRWNFSSSTTQISDISQEDEDGNNKAASLSNHGDESDDGCGNDLQLARGTVGELYHQLSSALGPRDRRPAALHLPSESDNASFSLDSPLPLDTPSPAVDCVTPLSIPRSNHFADIGKVCDPEGVEKPLALLALPQGNGRSASVEKERTRRREEEEEEEGDKVACGEVRNEDNSLSILGLIHLDLARYHEMGRLSVDQIPDMTLVMYHLTKAASCGVKDALYVSAHIYLQQPHDEFQTLTVEASEAHECEGMEFLVRAAERGMKPAMLEVGKALDMGVRLGKAPDNDPNFTATQRHQNWSEAIKWYRQVLGQTDDLESSDVDFGLTEPNYSILARMAEMYWNGGHSLERNSQIAGELYSEAADAAMTAMKGKLSTKYYMLAEEAWGEMQD